MSGYNLVCLAIAIRSYEANENFTWVAQLGYPQLRR